MCAINKIHCSFKMIYIPIPPPQIDNLWINNYCLNQRNRERSGKRIERENPSNRVTMVLNQVPFKNPLTCNKWMKMILPQRAIWNKVFAFNTPSAYNEFKWTRISFTFSFSLSLCISVYMCVYDSINCASVFWAMHWSCLCVYICLNKLQEI